MRNLDPALAAATPNAAIMPVVLAELTFQSGVERVWSGVGDLVYAGNTYSGVGNLGQVGAITEDSAVKADGTSVSLSGIGTSVVDLPASPVTPPDPPFTPPAGQSMAWAYATTFGPPGTFSYAPSVFNGFEGCSGAADATATTGSIGITGGDSLADTNLGVLWSNFRLPPEVPVGANIVGVYVVTESTASGTFAELRVNGGTISFGTQTSSNLHSLSGIQVDAQARNSLPMSNSSFAMGFVGAAVYYEGEPLSKASMIYEALNDVRLGGKAKIWFGLMAAGTFIGAPYLVFKGTVDKVTVSTSPETSTIKLALENRLVNLQRPNARRYTAADQHLAYPDDSGFNWVEILNDIALVWGN